MVGIDLGTANFLSDPGGGFVPNPRHARTAAERLEAAQQALARFPCVRRDKRTGNHHKAVTKVADLHRKVRRQRLDHAHKTALDLIRAHDFIAHEDLGIRNMLAAPAPQPDPDRPGTFLPNGTAAKTGLNKSINDAGWGVFLTILTSKAESGPDSDHRGPPQHLPHLPRMRAHHEGEPAHPGNLPLHQVQPHRARRHRGSHQRSTGRAGPSQRPPGPARSPRTYPGEESQPSRPATSAAWGWQGHPPVVTGLRHAAARVVYVAVAGMGNWAQTSV